MTDSRRRPVVLRTAGADPEPRRARRYLAWLGTGALGVVAAVGLVAGGTAVWSAFDPGTPGKSPAPLWFPPPETITPQSSKVTPTPTPTRTTEPGDDKGGEKKSSPGRSTSTSHRPTSGKSSGDDSTSGKSGKSGSGKGKSSDDGPGHH